MAKRIRLIWGKKGSNIIQGHGEWKDPSAYILLLEVCSKANKVFPEIKHSIQYENEDAEDWRTEMMPAASPTSGKADDTDKPSAV